MPWYRPKMQELRFFINPRTLTSGEFPPTHTHKKKSHVIFLVLLLSELHGTLGSAHWYHQWFGWSLLSSMFFFPSGTGSSDFHLTLVIENNIFYGWHLHDVSFSVLKSVCLNNILYWVKYTQHLMLVNKG